MFIYTLYLHRVSVFSLPTFHVVWLPFYFISNDRIFLTPLILWPSCCESPSFKFRSFSGCPAWNFFSQYNCTIMSKSTIKPNADLSAHSSSREQTSGSDNTTSYSNCAGMFSCKAIRRPEFVGFSPFSIPVNTSPWLIQIP